MQKLEEEWESVHVPVVHTRSGFPTAMLLHSTETKLELLVKTLK